MRKGAQSGGRRKPGLKSFAERAVQLGAVSAKVIDAAAIRTGPWVRLKCRFGCGGYGMSLCCPPWTPTPSEMREVLDSYSKAVFFEARRAVTKIAVTLEREVFLSGCYKAFGLGAGPCSLCKGACALGKGCRHPRQARPCLEGCGVDVFATARGNGFEIDVVRTRTDRTHFFGAVLVE